ncbi:putative phage abortive infection protein [Azonexus hydrophilus]|uniref:Phage abortive infection protein n=1 Tax=Azonexus hydrophilus TaxID=418702 RepID=A0ABZ2XID0_9RHOO
MKEGRANSLAEFLSENSVGILVGVQAVAVIAAIVVGGSYALFFWGESASSDPEQWGQLGDYLGGVLNPVFGFLSVFALLVALVLQTRELRLSRQSVQIANRELELSRRAQADSAGALDLQNKAIRKQSLEQTFFAWLGTYREALNEIVYIKKDGTLSGRQALLAIRNDLLAVEQINAGTFYHPYDDDWFPHPLVAPLEGAGLDSYLEVRAEHNSLVASAARKTWEILYARYENSLGSPFRVLYRLIKWIDQQDMSQEDKWLYVGIIRSQLSWIEMVFLFFNGMSDKGSNFKKFIERYAIFDNFTTHTDKLLTILKECPMDSVGYKQAAFSSEEARRAMAEEHQ